MSASRWLVVSVHDVAPPHWDRVRRTLEALDSVGVFRRSLLVIPNLRGQWAIEQHQSFCDDLRRRQREGDEIVLHGHEHTAVGAPNGAIDRFRNRWFTQGEGEFLSLDYGAARDRIQQGLAVTRRMNLDVYGFVPPAWLINADGLRAARDCGFEYTNSYFRFEDLALGRSHVSPSLVFGPGHLNEDIGVTIQRRVAGLLAWCPVVRVVLHPPCIEHPARFAQVLKMIETLASRRQPVTYFDLLLQMRSHAPVGVPREA